jgi:hypothetical protein
MDLLKFKSDALANFTKMLADVKAIKADHVKDATTILPLIAKFRADEEAMCSQLKIDRLSERQNALMDESAIVGELKKIAQDRLNATAEAAEHVQLRADRIQLQTDLIAGLNSRLATRQAGFTTLTADMAQIVTAVLVDPNASPQLVSDIEMAVNDKTNCLNTMMADIQTLIADRTKLAADLTAMQTV